MAEQLVLATRDGLAVAEPTGDGWTIARHDLRGREMTSVIAREGVILAGATDGVARSGDGGRTWSAADGLAIRHVRWLAFHPDISDRELAGTEPAGIFISRDGGGHWLGCPEVEALRDAHGWWLPYSPEAGCVRGFAFHGQRVLAAVEVGGLLGSDDGGAHWALVEGSDGRPVFGAPGTGRVHPDVHSVLIHPSSPELVVAPTGGGLYRSDDGGATWRCLVACYCRAAWWDPADPDHLIFGPADGPSGRNGRVHETRDGGRTWQDAGGGLGTPWSACLVERFTAGATTLFAVLSDGRLMAKGPAAPAWRHVLPELGGVNAVVGGAG
jgi:photosystem II stability/assembly factor-like uncharacterized protein